MPLKVTYENSEYCIEPFDTEVEPIKGIYRYIEFLPTIYDSCVYEGGSRVNICGYNSTFLDIKHENSTRADIELFIEYCDEATLYTRTLFSLLALIEAGIPKNKCVITRNKFDKVSEYLRYPGTGFINVDNRIELYSDYYVYYIHISDSRVTIYHNGDNHYVLSFIFNPVDPDYMLTLEMLVNMFRLENYEIRGDKLYINEQIPCNTFCEKIVPLYNEQFKKKIKSARK